MTVLRRAYQLTVCQSVSILRYNESILAYKFIIALSSEFDKEDRNNMSDRGAKFDLSELNSLPPDLLHDACAKLAHWLLYGESAVSDDPLARMAEQIFVLVLMDWARQAKAKEAASNASKAR
jgi:hypothetical protein